MKSMRGQRMFGRLLFDCGILAAYMASAGAQTLGQVAFKDHRWGYLAVSTDSRWKQVTPAEAGQLERQLRDDPENAQIRADLLNYYWHNNLRSERVDSICWLIEHHPESPILGLDFARVFPDHPPQNDAADFARSRALWESALNPIRVESEALHNAARFFEASNVDRSIELTKLLQSLDPADHTQPVAYFYGLVLSGRLGPSGRMDHLITSLPLLEDLAHSPDASLVGTVAAELVNYGAHAAIEKTDPDLSFVCLAAFQLLGRARQLEPQNSQWTDFLEGAQRLPCMSVAPPLVTVNPNPSPMPPSITVGSGVQAAHLIRPLKPDPPTGPQAGIEGVVRCRVRIGTDGHVMNVEVLSGNPLLVQLAIEALKQYEYTPTLLNGNPVEVETTVDIPFQTN
ncbi:MAG TPA: energy transducer TonB [Bryobacteraceae bacterium]|jgi:hypothetical protein|nr:energy transducer TonB [Bryobacteraceae bacterium]